MIDHSYEELRNVILDLLAGRESGPHELYQYEHLKIGVASVFDKRENDSSITRYRGGGQPSLSPADSELFLEIFWGLFREGIITLGMNDNNREFPFFKVSEFGSQLISEGQAYFFHDVSSYEGILLNEIPNINETTLLYVKEAMQAFKTGCILSSSVMLGVATEHTFLLLIEKIMSNHSHSGSFENVNSQRTILGKINKFKNILDQNQQSLPSGIKEDLDTNFAGILSVIRTFRNQSGHPTGKIIDREQAYILLQLFIPYSKKMYQLMEHFS
ncbi:MAG: hypothetical protein HQ556_04365 [Candidatus Marinimicrobia bacterium]|nr:hypothetical protein [Candidatus Neomarinimicrobiota bacterium]